MTRLTWSMVLGFVVAGGVLVLGTSRAVDKDSKTKELMIKSHRGDASPLGRLAKELKAEEPAWAEVQKSTKELVATGKALGKADVPSKPSAERYLESALALEAAAQKKDRTAITAAHKKLMEACNGCHYGGPPE